MRGRAGRRSQATAAALALALGLTVQVAAATTAGADGGAPPTVEGRIGMSPAAVTVSCHGTVPTTATAVFTVDGRKLTGPASFDLHWYTHGDDGLIVHEQTTVVERRPGTNGQVRSTFTLAGADAGRHLGFTVDDHAGGGTWMTTFGTVACGGFGDVTLPTVSLGTLRCDGTLTVSVDATAAATGRNGWRLGVFDGDGRFWDGGTAAARQRSRHLLTGVPLTEPGARLAVTLAAAPDDYSQGVRAYGGSYRVAASPRLAAGNC